MIMNGFSYLKSLDLDRKKHFKNLFNGESYTILKNFVSNGAVSHLRNFWIRDDLRYHFADKIANKDVSVSSPPYAYCGQTENDISYCLGVWNTPLDELTHEIMYQVALVRNLIVGNPLYDGLGFNCRWLQQYRVCRTVTGGEAVKRHADFMEEFRSDPTGSHKFSPSRLQATLFLSDCQNDYKSGGFYFDLDGRELFAEEMGLRPGDLLIWRYNLKHGVKDVAVDYQKNFGFLRVIYPSFELGDA
jgi:hypothetical protein